MDEKKIKKAAIYRPYGHLQRNSLTFENKTEKETFKVKLTEKLDVIEQTYSSDATKYDFRSIYRDMNMMFIWRDGKYYGSNVDNLLKTYNDVLKKKRTCSCYHTVPSAIWEIFFAFLIFCNLFHELLGE